MEESGPRVHQRKGQAVTTNLAFGVREDMLRSLVHVEFDDDKADAELTEILARLTRGNPPTLYEIRNRVVHMQNWSFYGKEGFWRKVKAKRGAHRRHG